MSIGKTVGLIKAVGGPGGGGTSNAVQYIPQELTEEQQMQARKNLGLYYSEVGKGEQLLPETTFETTEINGMNAGDIGNFPMDAGKRFVVVFDGVEYTLESYILSDSIFLGTQFDEATGQPLWDVPFAVGYAPYYNVATLLVQTAGTHVIIIYALSELVNPIPAKYLEREKYAVRKEDVDGVETWFCDLDFATAWKMSTEELRESLTYLTTEDNPLECAKVNSRTGMYCILHFHSMSVNSTTNVLYEEEVYLKWDAYGIVEIIVE